MFRCTLVEGDFWLPDIGPYHSFGLQAGSSPPASSTPSTCRTFWKIFFDPSCPGLFQALCPEGLFAVRFFASHGLEVEQTQNAEALRAPRLSFCVSFWRP